MSTFCRIQYRDGRLINGFTVYGNVTDATVDWRDGLGPVPLVLGYNSGQSTYEISYVEIYIDVATNITKLSFENENITSLATHPAFLSIVDAEDMFRNCPLFSGTHPWAATGDHWVNVTTMKNFAQNCSDLVYFGSKIPSVLTLENAFQNCTSLDEIPPLNATSVTTLLNAWDGCTSIIDIHLDALPSVTNATNAWRNCINLQSFPETADMPLVQTLTAAWQNCADLTVFPNININSATNISNAWDGCASLYTFPPISFVGTTIFTNAWRNCVNLQCLHELNTTTGTNKAGMFTGCTSLTRPDPAAITDLSDASGANWVNIDPCPQGQMFARIGNNMIMKCYKGNNAVDVAALASIYLCNKPIVKWHIIVTTTGIAPEFTLTDGAYVVADIGGGRFEYKSFDMITHFKLTTRIQNQDITQIEAILSPNTVTNMEAAFRGTTTTASVSIILRAGFDMSNVVDTQNFVSGWNKLTTVNFGAVDTSNVTNFGYMFVDTAIATSPGLNQVSGTNFHSMYDGVMATSVDLGWFLNTNAAELRAMIFATNTLLCLTNLKTTNNIGTLELFNWCTVLVQPDGCSGDDTPHAGTCAALVAGSTWTNPGTCP